METSDTHTRSPQTHVLVVAVFVLHLKVAVVEVDGRNVGVARVDDRADPRGKEGELLVLWQLFPSVRVGWEGGFLMTLRKDCTSPERMNELGQMEGNSHAPNFAFCENCDFQRDTY